jgi:hypothetical protein
MQQPFSVSAGGRANNYRQAYALLLLGVVLLVVAWLGFLNPYPLGVLIFGVGMLEVAPLNPRRFLSAGWLMTSQGVATFLSRFPFGSLDLASLATIHRSSPSESEKERMQSGITNQE